MTRDELAAAIKAVDERLERLRPRILAHGAQPLAEGTWRVRGALSHLAARANGVDRVVQRAKATASGAPTAPPRSIDEINAGQVEERRDLTAEQLLDEIKSGHAAALVALQGVDDATLEQRLPLGFRPGDSSVAEMMFGGGPRHDQGHLDQVESALPEQ